MLLGIASAFAIAAIYASAGSWWMLIPAIVLTSLARIERLADIIFINYTKTEQSGTIIGLTRTIWAIPATFAPLIAAWIVSRFGGITAQGIRPLYYLQIVLAFVVFVFIAMALTTPPAPRPTDSGPLKSKVSRFLQDFRDFFAGERYLKRWIAIRIIWSFTMRLATPFIPLWMVDVKGATAPILGVMGTASAIFSVVMPVLAGRLTDKIGRKNAYFLLRPFMYLRTILLILVPRPEYLIFAGVLAGIGQAYFVPFITMHWEIVPESKRGRWYGIEGFINIFAIPATLLSGFLWQQGYMIEVLLLPIILEVLLLIPIMTTIPDTLDQDTAKRRRETRK
jgi:MFS family permease